MKKEGKKRLFERAEFYQKRKSRIESEDLPLREWFDSKENDFYEKVIKREDLYLKEGPVLKENQFDKKRGIELSNQILPLVNFDIKKEEFLFFKGKITLKRPFLERTTPKKTFEKDEL